MKPGDWTCRRCGSHNFASRKECKRYNCSEWRPKHLIPSKEGDWDCPTCHYKCFASKTSCPKCNTQKPMASKDITRQNGDWDCDTCKEVNFGSRVVCRKCNQPRPKDGQVDTDDGSCSICLDEKATIAPSGCGHLSMCTECSKKVSKCPMCRSEFSQLELIKIFQC